MEVFESGTNKIPGWDLGLESTSLVPESRADGQSLKGSAKETVKNMTKK